MCSFYSFVDPKVISLFNSFKNPILERSPPMKLRTSFMQRLSSRLSLGSLLLLGLFLGLGVGVRPAYASKIITVNPCNQSSLQAAINEANKDNDGDTIKFKCGGKADIKLTSTLSITGNMTINGSGQKVTLDGQNTVAVFYLNSPHLTLTTLTIANGKAFSGSNNSSGGGIYNVGGTVSITKITLSGNSASFEGGGIYNNGGILTISRSTLNNNSAYAGGGIYNNGGTVNITKSTLSSNSAYVAGGIFNESGMIRIAKSTLNNNTASNDGGGIYNTSTMNINNSTLSSNSASSAGGGIANIGGTVKISNITLSANSAYASGGIYTSGTLSISGSIVAENSASQGNDCSGTITDMGYNLESGTDCGFTGKGSLQNVRNAQLALSALANNGGPTKTMALQQGSVAIDQIAKVQCQPNDQRGETRPDAGESNCDMGAYESNY
jgi:hypothetical protein